MGYYPIFDRVTGEIAGYYNEKGERRPESEQPPQPPQGHHQLDANPAYDEDREPEFFNVGGSWYPVPGTY
jgi:hypothetical protein